jgi:heme a synthase
MASCIGMFIVLIAGALVTKTESGRGCGDDWPLCNGKFIPAYTIESMIEYNHRAITGIVGIIVLLTFIAVYRAYSKRSEQYIYASGVLFFTILQAILGAMAVKWEQSSAVMALHFGFSMLALTFTLLLAASIWRKQQPSMERQVVRPAFRWLVWISAAYSYAVVYLGAFVRHTESQAGCLGWPLCNNEVIPELSGATGIAFIHRLGALLLFILVVVMTAYGLRKYGRHREIRQLTVASFVLVALQIFSGAFVVWTMHMPNAYLAASMLHTTIVSAAFAVMCYLGIRTWQLR